MHIRSKVISDQGGEVTHPWTMATTPYTFWLMYQCTYSPYSVEAERHPKRKREAFDSGVINRVLLEKLRLSKVKNVTLPSFSAGFAQQLTIIPKNKHIVPAILIRYVSAPPQVSSFPAGEPDCGARIGKA